MANKLLYYAVNFGAYMIPKFVFTNRYRKIIDNYISEHPEQEDYLHERVDFYNDLSEGANVGEEAIELKDFVLPKKSKKSGALRTYFFDTYEYTRYFEDSLKITTKFGDVTTVPKYPSFVKSRPIEDGNQNSIILKLNKIRHYNFIKDPIKLADKKDILIGRMSIYSIHKNRQLFMQKFFNHPMCDVGQVNTRGAEHMEWVTPKISIADHLPYKFILCLEGNDVATNLKWVMSSNSLPVMPRPRYETWFMESKLLPGVNYVELQDDYSDLEEKMNYYIAHPDEAQTMVENNHRYVSQFLDMDREKVLSLMVIEKFFRATGQL